MFNLHSRGMLAGAVLLVCVTSPAAGQDFSGVAQRGQAAGNVFALAVDPVSPDTIYVSLSNPYPGFFKTTDAGSTWSNLGPGVENNFVYEVAIDPRRHSTIYAGTLDGLFKSEDGGGSWRRLPGFVSTGALAIDPVVSSTIHAGGHCFLKKTTDGGATWINEITGVALGASISDLAFEPGLPSTLYASWVECRTTGGPSEGGVLKSTDAGLTWIQLTNGIGKPLARTILVLDNAPQTVLAGTDSGLFRSTDGGASWVLTNAGLSPGFISDLAADPRSPSTVYLSGTVDLFRSTDAGQSWEPLGLAGPVHVAVVDPRSSSTIYAGTDNGAFVSRDGGATWRVLFEGVERSCDSSPETLCLAGGRFRVEVSWTAGSFGTSGPGRAVPLTGNAGAFWFFVPSNLELVVKVLDGRTINGGFWVFYGALSNVEYTLTVTDTVTGAQQIYFNPQGRLASIADTDAF